MRKLALFLIFILLPVSAVQPQSRRGKRPRLVLVYVIDGLRPDSINEQDTPNLFRLRSEGVSYVNSHSVFPTVTRVNTAAITTGCYPIHNGLVSNSMYVPSVDPLTPFNTADFLKLLKMKETTGHLLLTECLSQRLTKAGIKYAGVSSGSTGNAFLLNPVAPQGVGILVNGNFDPGKRVAWPDSVSKTILDRYGGSPKEEAVPLVDWTEKAFREYVLPELHPQVAVDWMTEPDTTQHRYGVGSTEARAALKNSDRHIGLAMQELGGEGILDSTDIIVVSDHGFGHFNYGVDLDSDLIKAGLKSGADSDDVVIASNGPSVLIYVKNRDRQRIKGIVEFLQKQQWAGVMFTAAAKRESGAAEPNPQGWVPGTFSLELIHEPSTDRGPDIILTFPWSDEANAFGVHGSDYTTAKATGAMTGNASGHGSMSPYAVTNTMLLWGVDFKKGAVIDTPSSNVDVTPTILALEGLPIPPELDGRPLREAFRNSPKGPVAQRRTYKTEGPGNYHASIQMSVLGKSRYVDKSWRVF